MPAIDAADDIKLGSTQVAAVYLGADGVWSSATAPTAPTAPTGAPEITADPVSATSIEVTWAAVDDATSYEMSLDGDVAFTVTSPATVDELLAETTYGVRVRAVNAGGAGPWSDTSNVTTPDVYGGLVLASGAFAFWRLDETSGTTVADERGVYDGTSSGEVEFVEGAVGGAYHFKRGATAPHAVVTTLGSWGSNLPESSIEFWMKTITTRNDYLLGTLNDDNTMMVYVRMNVVGGTQFAIRDNTNTVGNWLTTANLYDGAWHHCVITIGEAPIGDGSVTWYVDGEAVTTTHSTNSPSDFSDLQYPLALGSLNVRGAISNHAFVTLDEVAIYSRELTVGEIADHYAEANLNPLIVATEQTELLGDASWTWFHQPIAAYYEDI